MLINMQDAKETALARNPKARLIGVNASWGDDNCELLNCNPSEVKFIFIL